MNGIKALSVTQDGDLTSYARRDSGVIYRSGEWAVPKDGDGPLCVFPNDLDYAMLTTIYDTTRSRFRIDDNNIMDWLKRNELRMYKCEYEVSQDNSVWKSYYQSKIVSGMDLLFPLTKLASRVMITNEVTPDDIPVPDPDEISGYKLVTKYRNGKYGPSNNYYKGVLEYTPLKWIEPPLGFGPLSLFNTLDSAVTFYINDCITKVPVKRMGRTKAIFKCLYQKSTDDSMWDGQINMQRSEMPKGTMLAKKLIMINKVDSDKINDLINYKEHGDDWD